MGTLSTIVVLMSLLALASSKTYYVKPIADALCPNQEDVPCLTLSQYANKSKTNYFFSDTTLILLPRNHSLETSFQLKNVTFSMYPMSSDTNTTITCNVSATFTFDHMEHVSISDIAFYGCVNNAVTLVRQFTLQDCQLYGQGRDGTGLYLNQVVNATIVRCYFSGNTGKMLTFRKLGGAIFAINSEVSIFSGLFTENAIKNAIGNGDCAYHVCGGAVYASNSTIYIANTIFFNNICSMVVDCNDLFPNVYGGAICVDVSNITIDHSTFSHNKVSSNFSDCETGGGAISISPFDCERINTLSVIVIDNSNFLHNEVNSRGGDVGGGAVYVDYAECYSSIRAHCNISHGKFFNNAITYNGEKSDDSACGGAVAVDGSTIVLISYSTFAGNAIKSKMTAFGAAICIFSTQLVISDSTIENNTMYPKTFGYGGAVSAWTAVVHISNSYFSGNNASMYGGAISLQSSNFTSNDTLWIEDNEAHFGAVFGFNSKLHLSGAITITHNSGNKCNGEGGGMSLYHSHLTIDDASVANLTHNCALRGGAILLTESVMKTYGEIIISHNAAKIGGAVFTFQTEVNLQGNVTVSRNIAHESGGGIHAISSILNLVGSNSEDDDILIVFKFVANYAKKGGGMYLASNSRLYIIKSEDDFLDLIYLKLEFINNSARVGGALYIDDETNSATCKAIPFKVQTKYEESCFFQVIQSDDTLPYDNSTVSNIVNMFFTNNSATTAGGTIYGGLLDRCAVNPFMEIFSVYHNITPTSLTAISYFLKITHGIEAKDLNSTAVVSSDPVQVCFCLHGKPNCSYQPTSVVINRNQPFFIPLVAVDQVNNSIPATIKGSVVSQHSQLREGHLQNVSNGCSYLEFVVFSKLNSETLLLYPDGPCLNKVGISERKYKIEFLPCDSCPIGFKADNSCLCLCAPELHSFVSECLIESLIPKGGIWISYSNESGYVGHHCPFDYCNSFQVKLNLSKHDGSDEQCAFNRSGLLCGQCDTNLSLSLGSSNCKSCHNYWLLLIFPFSVAGLALVFFLLFCNLTVAIGTINGLIFYANILGANRAVFFPSMSETYSSWLVINPLTIFVSWINLDLGIETCFYNGMTTYAKTWLQLVFPVYIILLVVLTIITSRYSAMFSKYLTSNSVPTLATLMLLSYTKVLRAIISALSFTELHYSNTSENRKVWLLDANVDYFRGKHIALFVTAIFLLFVGLVYTFLLLSWQWVYPLLTKFRYFKTSTVIRSTNHFMDAYHAPYKPRHRYWVGLLLLVRAILYLVSAVNVLGDPHVSLVAICVAMFCLLFFQSFVMNVYKKWLVNLLESTFFVNMGILAVVTMFAGDMDIDHESTQATLVYISVGIAFITFVAITVCHIYAFAIKRITRSKFRAGNYGSLSVRLTSDQEAIHQSVSQGLREPLDLIDEDPSTEDYRKVAQASTTPVAQSIGKQNVTHTEVIITE